MSSTYLTGNLYRNKKHGEVNFSNALVHCRTLVSVIVNIHKDNNVFIVLIFFQKGFNPIQYFRNNLL